MPNRNAYYYQRRSSLGVRKNFHASARDCMFRYPLLQQIIILGASQYLQESKAFD